MSKRNAVLVGLAFLIGASASILGQGTVPGQCRPTANCTITGTWTFSTPPVGAGSPGGSNTYVQFNDSSAFGGDAGLTYNKTTDRLTMGKGTISGSALSSLLVGPNAQALADNEGFAPLWAFGSAGNTDLGAGDWGGAQSLITTWTPSVIGSNVNGSFSRTTITNTTTVALNNVAGAEEYVTHLGTGLVTRLVGRYLTIESGNTGGATEAFGTYTTLSPYNVSNIGTGYAHYVNAPVIASGGTMGTNHAFYAKNQISASITNSYAFWYDGGAGANCDSGGVTRINDVGIYAYYNPCFAKYVPAAANHERIIVRWGDTGVFGTDNNAYIGVEVGGTGTNRQFNLLGASVHAMTVPGTYAAFRSLTTQPTSNYLAVDGTAGLTQTCATPVTAVTIKNGLITAVTCP